MLPSGKQYVLKYDGSGNLLAVTLPGLGRHHFHQLTTLGRHRRMYTAPGIHNAYMIDFDGSGKPLEISYASNQKRVLYMYDGNSRIKRELFDWSSIDYSYYEKQGILHSITLLNRISGSDRAVGFSSFTCTLSYEPAAALIKRHTVTYNGTEDFQLWSARFSYHYDNHFRVILRETVLGVHAFHPLNFSYSLETGRLERMKSFVFNYNILGEDNRRKDTVRDENIIIERATDEYGRCSDTWYRFNNNNAFTSEMTYNRNGRLSRWRRMIGSDTKSYEYIYDIDDNLLEVHLSNRVVWRYEYDANSNLVKLIHHERERNVVIDKGKLPKLFPQDLEITNSGL